MKLPAFEYAAPKSVAEAVALLAASGGEAKVLAGGQSLMPILAFRLAAPKLLVDLRKIPDLNQIRIDKDGVQLGARVRWRDIQDDDRLKRAHPLLQAAIAHVAHYQIRNRGTVGGSLAHADPAAEMPGIAVTCDAELTIVGKAGARTQRASDFLTGALSTTLAPDEVITEIKLPPWPPGRRYAFEEFARRRGDFAMAGIALFYDLDESGRAKDAHIGAIGAASHARRLTAAEAALNGRIVDEPAILAAAEAASQAVDPSDDIHASAAYRRALVATLTERALKRAAA